MIKIINHQTPCPDLIKLQETIEEVNQKVAYNTGQLDLLVKFNVPNWAKDSNDCNHSKIKILKLRIKEHKYKILLGIISIIGGIIIIIGV